MFSQKFIRIWTKKPGLSLLMGFLIIIAIGSTLLSLPQAVTDNQPISFPDALFTATSATCVTGLLVKDTATYFSRFGQIVILILIQLGAIGIMSAGVFFIIILGKKISLAQQINIKNIFSTKFTTEAMRLVKLLVIFTFSIELIGALILFFYKWPNDFFHALFHSISAFANAGFSLFSDSFMQYREDLSMNIIITLLIIVGGLGFMVLVNLWDWLRHFFKNKRPGKLSLHSKIVLTATIVLIVLGAWFFYTLERADAWAGYSSREALLASYFQSVTARTAGFSTVNVGDLSIPSRFFLMGLMFVGGGPGSTAGGIKITTFVLLLIMIISILKGRKRGYIFKRSIPEENIRKAMAIVVLSFLVLVFFWLLLTLTEEGAPLKDIAFEATSAFGTVGLSTGLTFALSYTGKIIFVILMLVGRLGPLTLAFLLAKAPRVPKITYPQEKIGIG